MLHYSTIYLLNPEGKGSLLLPYMCVFVIIIFFAPHYNTLNICNILIHVNKYMLLYNYLHVIN